MANMTKAAANRVEFARFLKAKYPALYRAAKSEADKASASGLGEANGEEKQGWFSSFLQAAGSLGTTYLSLRAQKEVLEQNIKRAEAGMPPIDVPTAPTVRTQVEVPPDVVDKITASASGALGSNVNKILLFAGAAAAAFLLFR